MSSISSQNNKWLAGIFLSLCLIVLIGYVTELPIMMNYLDVGSFWRLGLTAGSIIGIIAGVITTKKIAIDESVTRLRVFFMLFFFSLLTIPLLISWSNRLFPSHPTPTTVTIDSELARYGDRFGNIKNKTAAPTTYVLFFVLDHQLYRTSSKKPFFPNAETGDQVILNIHQGRWGYRWVSHDEE